MVDMADERNQDEQPKRYQVRPTPDGAGPCYGRDGRFPYMVLDTTTDKAVAFCRKPETADEYAHELNTKGIIEI
jgi:hypothetical protein